MDLHGGNIYKLARNGKKDILDYSSNINPLGVPEKFKQEVISNFEVLERYPDPEYVQLRESIGNYNGVGMENIVVGNGATEVLFLYMQGLKPKKALIVAPAFAEYRRALDSVGCEILYYKLAPEKNFTFDIEDFLKNLPQCDLVIICNPNNPTGTFITLENIKKINNILKAKKIKLFIDEAFIEFIKEWKDKSAVLLADKNIFVMRAMTKFFAVPGLRLGYGIYFDEELAQRLKEKIEPWSVNSFAEIAGRVMLEDEKYIRDTEEWIEKEKKWFYNELIKLPNIKVFKTETNFILIKLGNMKADICRDRMIEKKILIRDASNFKFLNENYIRIAIKDREKNERFLKAFKEVLMWRE